MASWAEPGKTSAPSGADVDPELLRELDELEEELEAACWPAEAEDDTSRHARLVTLRRWRDRLLRLIESERGITRDH